MSIGKTEIFTLLNNIALLLIMSVAYESTNLLTPRHQKLKPWITGAALAAACVVIMNLPFTLRPGLVYDTRSILISVTALMFGWIPTIMTSATAILLRISTGGIGTLSGIAVIVSSAAIGLGWRYYVYPKTKARRYLSAFLMGVVVHIAMLICTLLLPYPQNIAVIRIIALPVLTIYPAGSILLSVLLIRQQDFKGIQDQLAQSQERFKALFDKAPLGYQSLDSGGCFIEVNQQWMDLLGYAKEEVLGKWFGDFVAPAYRDAFQQRFPVFKERGRIHSELQMIHKNGGFVFIAFDGRIGYDANGEFLQTHCILKDISNEKKMGDDLRISEEKYSTYINSAPFGIFVVNENGEYIDSNPAASKITGYDRERLLQMSIRDITAKESIQDAIQGFQVLKQSGSLDTELQFIRADGTRRWWTVTATKLLGGRYLGFSTDITDRKNAQEELIFLSNRDFLTGLYNRRYFESELKRVDTNSHVPVSIIMGDINGVKLINDAFGHAEGDRLIMESARIIRSCCRESDTLARIGGDEFGLIMPNTDSATALKVLTGIQSALKSFDLFEKNDRFQHSVSLGFGTKKTPKEDIGQVIKIAEEYMYQRKLLEHTSSHSAIISSIKATMFEKSHETEEHAERLVILSKRIANGMNLAQKDRDRLELLATLHDIGKVGISDRILSKPSKLTDEEWVEMKRHPEIGYRIAMSSPELIPVAEGILCHQERWDGTGYPQGLKDENIPLLSRIIAVVDAYDAMTQDRPYRAAMTRTDAIAEIERNAGSQFDPQVAHIFVQQMRTAEPFETNVGYDGI